MKIILAFLLSLVIAIVILAILYEPAKKQMYKKKSVHSYKFYSQT